MSVMWHPTVGAGVKVVQWSTLLPLCFNPPAVTQPTNTWQITDEITFSCISTFIFSFFDKRWSEYIWSWVSSICPSIVALQIKQQETRNVLLLNEWILVHMNPCYFNHWLFLTKNKNKFGTQISIYCKIDTFWIYLKDYLRILNQY